MSVLLLVGVGVIVGVEVGVLVRVGKATTLESTFLACLTLKQNVKWDTLPCIIISHEILKKKK